MAYGNRLTSRDLHIPIQSTAYTLSKYYRYLATDTFTSKEVSGEPWNPHDMGYAELIHYN